MDDKLEQLKEILESVRNTDDKLKQLEVKLECVRNENKLLEAERERSKRLRDMFMVKSQALQIAIVALKAEKERLIVENEQLQEIQNVLEQDGKGSLSC